MSKNVALDAVTILLARDLHSIMYTRMLLCSTKLKCASSSTFFFLEITKVSVYHRFKKRKFTSCLKFETNRDELLHCLTDCFFFCKIVSVLWKQEYQQIVTIWFFYFFSHSSFYVNFTGVEI